MGFLNHGIRLANPADSAARYCFAILMALLTMQPAICRGSTDIMPTVRIPADRIHEAVTPQGQTSSSGRISGILIDPSTLHLSKPEFVVHGISAGDREFCVNIARANNLYEADFRFRSPNRGSMVLVQFESGAWRGLLPLMAGEMSIMVRSVTQGRCSGPALPARWGQEADITNTAVMYNGGQAESARIQVEQQPAIPCLRLADSGLPATIMPVRFTHICPVSLPSDSCGKVAHVSIQRNFAAEYLDPERIPVRIPCPIL